MAHTPRARRQSMTLHWLFSMEIEPPGGPHSSGSAREAGDGTWPATSGGPPGEKMEGRPAGRPQSILGVSHNKQ